MRITQLRLENFKSFKEPTTIDFAPVTLLFGSNSAGKSSIIQALSFLTKDVNNIGDREFESLFNQYHFKDSQGRSFRKKSETLSIGASVDIGDVDLIEGQSAEALNGYLDIYEEANSEVFADFSILTSTINSIGVSNIYDQNKSLSSIDIWLNNEKFICAKPLQLRSKNLNDTNKERQWLFSGVNQAHSLLANDDFASIWNLVDDALDNNLSNGQLQFGIKGRPGSTNMVIGLTPTVWSDSFESSLSRKIIESFIGFLLKAPFEVLEEELDATSHLGPLRIVPEEQDTFENANDYDGSQFWKTVGKFGEYQMHRLSDMFTKTLGSEYSVINQFARVIYESDADAMLHQDCLFMNDGDTNCENPFFSEQKEQEVKQAIDQQKISLYNSAEFSKYGQTFFTNKEGVFTPKNVGVGLSQVLPVVMGSSDPKIRFFSVEQPELHIHPRMQTGLADVFLENTGSSQFADVSDDQDEREHIKLKLGLPDSGEIENFVKSEKPVKPTKTACDALKTFLIETHSEHLVLRLLRRIREGKYAPDFVSVLYVEKIDGYSKIVPLRIDEEGDFIDEWPGGFFDERDEEFF
jgi:hypothetical protein